MTIDTSTLSNIKLNSDTSNFQSLEKLTDYSKNIIDYITPFNESDLKIKYKNPGSPNKVIKKQNQSSKNIKIIINTTTSTEENYQRALVNQEKGLITQALQHFREAARFGHIESIFQLARACDKGHYKSKLSKEERRAKSFQNYTQAAEKNHVGSMYYLSKCYLKGLGTTPYFETAKTYLINSANLGWANAQFKLAQDYDKGGVSNPLIEQNDAEAFKWYKQATDQKHVKALMQLGSFHEKGRGTKADANKALECYLEASKLNNPKAKSELARLSSFIHAQEIQSFSAISLAIQNNIEKALKDQKKDKFYKDLTEKEKEDFMTENEKQALKDASDKLNNSLKIATEYNINASIAGSFEARGFIQKYVIPSLPNNERPLKPKKKPIRFNISRNNIMRME